MKCERCKVGELVAKRVHRNSPAAVTWGYVLIVPGTLFLLASIMLGGLTLMGFVGAGATMPAEGEAPSAATEVLGCLTCLGGCALPIAVLMLLVSIPSLIVGTILTGSKGVWECAQCRSIFERS